MLSTQIRPGAYHDSVVLMQLQRALAALPSVVDAGVIMATPANKELLAQGSLLTPEAEAAGPEDLVIVIRSETQAAADDALARVDALLTRSRGGDAGSSFRPKSLETAAAMLPDAGWVLVSTPGRYAADVARGALRLGKNVFLYSDNVELSDEIALKREARERGLLVMGPDCGTALVNGIGLGFANRVRRGALGIVAASGTGLQQVAARIHQLGGGVSHGLGLGGRDLSEAVGGITASAALDLLAADADTEVIVFISKPPAPVVADRLLRQARSLGKPIVVNFIGLDAAQRTASDPLRFAATLDETAQLAVDAATASKQSEGDALPPFSAEQRYLRGLYSGGTLAYEAQWILRDYVPQVYSNAPLDKQFALERVSTSREHSILDLGDDEFTVGRLHPMLDNDLRLRRLRQEAADPQTAVLLLDVVLGYGAHPDPAGEIAPVIAEARRAATQAGRHLEVVAAVVGTDEDPQGLDRQIALLEDSGAFVRLSHAEVVAHAGRLVQRLAARQAGENALCKPLAAINVGVEAFAESLTAQGAPVVHVDWRPPASGNERMMGILARMKAKT